MKEKIILNNVCIKSIEIDYTRLDKDAILNDLIITGGCKGQGNFFRKIFIGKKFSEIITMGEDNLCRNETSCADQIAIVLKDRI